jgi:hypothetical protein
MQLAARLLLLFSNSSASVLACIQQTSAHVESACQVVQLVVANRYQAHRDCVYESCSAPSFSPSNLILVRVQVTSNTEINRVANLSCQVRGPFCAVSHTSGSFRVVPICMNLMLTRFRMLTFVSRPHVHQSVLLVLSLSRSSLDCF